MIYGWRHDLQPEIIILESLLHRGILQHTDDSLTSGRKRCIQLTVQPCFKMRTYLHRPTKVVFGP